MRFAIFGDIHGNLEALETVLAAIKDLNVDEYICMGDIVGYGANPNECLKIIRQLGCLTIAGNHDHAVIGCLDISYFNQYARQSTIWTREILSAENRAYLAELPFIEHTSEFTVVHGSLHAPEMFNYVQTVRDAEFNFRIMDKGLLFIGHSHQPLGFFDTDPMTYTLDQDIPLNPILKTIINVGSVGQPRDEDPRSSFCIYDSAENLATIHRLEYDIDTAASKILAAGLPEPLALRLALGK